MAKVSIKEQKDRLSKINALLEKLDERLVQGEITEARYKELSDQYKAEAEKLKNQVTEQELMQEVGLKAEEKEDVEYKEKVKYIEKVRYREEEPEKPVFEEHGTKYCSSCGTLINENSEFCNQCGERVSTPQVYREKKIHKNNINTNVNVSVSTPPVYQEKKSAALAAVASLVMPGAGQMYCGKWTRGIGILIVTIILYIISEAAAADMYSDEPFVLLIILIIYRIWSIYDAYKIAGKINRGED